MSIVRRDEDGALQDRVVIVTGSGSGIGRASALRFAQAGAKVVGADFNAATAAQTDAVVREVGGEITSLAPLDLTDEEQAKRLIDFATSTYGRIDVLYNAAGALRTGLADTMSREDFQYTLDHEFMATWLPIKHAVSAFRSRGRGVIINIGSISGMIGTGNVGNTAGLIAHAVGKGAVIRLTTHLAAELSPDNIRVNCISPGIIDTPSTRPALGDDADSLVRQAYLEALLIPRIGLPEDVAAAALFLASDEASYITAVNLPVDGGWTGGGGMGQPKKSVDRLFEEAITGFATGTEVGGHAGDAS